MREKGSKSSPAKTRLAISKSKSSLSSPSTSPRRRSLVMDHNNPFCIECPFCKEAHFSHIIHDHMLKCFNNKNDDKKLENRPTTALLEHPAILDERLKSKVDMSKTTKQELHAVQLCSDVALQRGINNMRSTRSVAANLQKKKVQSNPNNPAKSSTQKSPTKPSKTAKPTPNATKTTTNPTITTTKPSARAVSIKQSLHARGRSRVRKSVLGEIVDGCRSRSSSRHTFTLKDEPKMKLKRRSHLPRLQTKKKSPFMIAYNKKRRLKSREHKKKHLEALNACQSCGRPEHPERLHTHKSPERKQMNRNNNENDDKKEENNNENSDKKGLEKTNKTSTRLRNRVANKGLTSNRSNESLAPLEPMTDNRVSPSRTPKASIIQVQSTDKKEDRSRLPRSPVKVVRIGPNGERRDVSEPSNLDTNKKNVKKQALKSNKSRLKVNKNGLQSDVDADRSSLSSADRSESSGGSTGSTVNASLRCGHCSAEFGSRGVLANHEKNCSKKKMKNNNAILTTTTSSTSSMSSLSTLCQVCGRHFSRSSLAFHEKQCRRKHELLQERREALLLQEQQENEDNNSRAVYFYEEENDNDKKQLEQAWEAHVSQLVPCAKCGRTFFPDRLEKHERSCGNNNKNIVVLRPDNIGNDFNENNVRMEREVGQLAPASPSKSMADLVARIAQ